LSGSTFCKPPALPEVADCGSGQPQSVAIACKFMPYLSVKFTAPLQASSHVGWVKNQKVAKFHGHTLWIPEIRMSDICVMNGQLIQYSELTP
jgi:hypothetical protein